VTSAVPEYVIDPGCDTVIVIGFDSPVRDCVGSVIVNVPVLASVIVVVTEWVGLERETLNDMD